jgi:tRNA (cmo5U34)-methyltransferase
LSIEEQFNRIAKEYDVNRRNFIPCFDEYYEATTNFIASNIEAPQRVLDLGAGTGLLTYYWYKKFELTKYVLVDIADEMLNVARKRFANISNIEFEVLDYSKEFPSGKFDCIISALSIHHLEYEEKKKLFSDIYNRLPTGGIFVNYDQFCGGSSAVDTWFDTYWISRLEESCLTSKDIEQWKERRKMDREISVEEEVQMLHKCSFAEVKCVYLNQKFAVIVAVK